MRGEVRAGRWEGVGRRRRKRHDARGRPDSRLLRVKARAERTSNMANMFVTLEVSKLSGWLKARACCRGSQAGRTVRGAREAAGERAVHAACHTTAEGGTDAVAGRGEQSAPETCLACL